MHVISGHLGCGTLFVLNRVAPNPVHESRVSQAML